MSANLKNAIRAINKSALLYGSVSALALSGMSGVVNAQEDGLQTEEVVVTGIRAALQNALDTKRDSTAIVDAISAEDIGKFPDRNVAESLQRIPGVTIQRQFGEGAAVSIRGAGNELTQTTLNGQNVASTGWFVLEPAKRSFNYELLPSELVGNVEVFKSPRADLMEGGVGGSVVVHTRKPLDQDALSVFGSIEGQYQSDSGEMDPQFSGLVSWKNDAESLGILLAGVQQKRSLQRRGNEAFWQWGAGPVAFTQDRERTGLAATVQFAPTDELDIALNLVDLQMKADNVNYAVWLTQLDTTWGGGETTEWLNNTPVAGPLNVAFAQTRPRKATMNSSVYDLDVNYTTESFEIHAQVGRTESDGGTSFESVFEDTTGGTSIVAPASSYDFSEGHQTWNLPQGFLLHQYSPGLTLGTGAVFNQTPKTDEEDYFQLDGTLFLDGAITSVKAGARYAEHETTSTQHFMGVNAGADLTFDTTDPANADGLLDVGTGGLQMIHFDEDAMFAFAEAAWDGTTTEDLGSHNEIHEENAAVYVMAEYEVGGFAGDFGVRAVDTTATSVFFLDQGAGFQRTEVSEGYSEILPNVNVKYNLTDDVVIRGSIARTMARPQYVDMYVNPSPIGANDEVPNNQFWVVGNVGLKPYLSDQADIGVEWYFAEGSLLSAAVFAKDVENFVTIAEYHADASAIPFTINAAEQAVGWTVQEKSNAKTAEIRGLELQYQQDYGNGFGSVINYTYTDARADAADTFTDENAILTDSSRHMANMSVYFENDAVDARLSYNWRSEYMIRESGSYGNRLHEDFGTLDFSGTLFLTDNVELTLDVNNILEEGSIQTGNNADSANNGAGGATGGFERGFPLYEYQMSRNIALGVSFRF